MNAYGLFAELCALSDVWGQYYETALVLASALAWELKSFKTNCLEDSSITLETTSNSSGRETLGKCRGLYSKSNPLSQSPSKNNGSTQIQETAYHTSYSYRPLVHPLPDHVLAGSEPWKLVDKFMLVLLPPRPTRFQMYMLGQLSHPPLNCRWGHCLIVTDLALNSSSFRPKWQENMAPQRLLVVEVGRRGNSSKMSIIPTSQTSSCWRLRWQFNTVFPWIWRC